MKAQINLPQLSQDLPQLDFQPGEQLIYALHGRVSLEEIETFSHENESNQFFKLTLIRQQNSPQSYSPPFFRIPIKTARKQGLRTPMNVDEAKSALALFLGPEYFFSLDQNWKTLLTQFDKTIKTEGGHGLAKVYSFLLVAEKKRTHPESEISKMKESIRKVLIPELSTALALPNQYIHDQILNGLKEKLRAST